MCDLNEYKITSVWNVYTKNGNGSDSEVSSSFGPQQVAGPPIFKVGPFHISFQDETVRE